jgi:hypothetical protein
MKHEKTPIPQHKEEIAEATPSQEETSMFEQALEAYKQAYAPYAPPSKHRPAWGGSLSDEEEEAHHDPEEGEALEDDLMEGEEEPLSPEFQAFLKHLSTLPAGTPREIAYAPFPELKARVDALVPAISLEEPRPSNFDDVSHPQWTPITKIFFATSLVLLGILIVLVVSIRNRPHTLQHTLARLDQPQPPIRPPSVIDKGAKQPVQMIYARKPILKGQRVTSQTVLHEGDHVSFFYEVEQPTFVLIASLDERGVVSFYYPFEAEKKDAKSLQIQGIGMLPKTGSITLDGSKGRESIFVITSQRSFSPKEIRTHLQAAFQKKTDLFLIHPFPSSSDLRIMSRFNIRKK